MTFHNNPMHRKFPKPKKAGGGEAHVGAMPTQQGSTPDADDFSTPMS